METQEGSRATEGAMKRWIADIDGVLDLVEAILEHSEPEQESDENHYQNHARAQHAHPASATHDLLVSFLNKLKKTLIRRKKERKKDPFFCVFLESQTEQQTQYMRYWIGLDLIGFEKRERETC
ncbi:hypothetical protein PanWU01x14_246160 [Parasponia andersonii]|uniref:Uncharacterized protein n=1 Tax=Parasponia andersonii TaxID=3476 RepID=A0A2P5BEL6_PARAD|nr:hypothetical protein PanWU01x14_246160 [Parasponia andersonii]